jgi:serine/threonine protein kinase
MPIKLGTRIGPYEVTSPLGEGGMGVVFRAHDTKVQRDVALKLLPDHFANDANRLLRFQREAQVLASLNHPNSAQIYGLEESNNTRCIVMELVAGETLQERLKRGPIPLDEALVIAKQIAEALEVAHEKGIIHRDLKPANIKLTPDAQVKVLDFGLAKAFQEQPESRVSDSPTLISASVPGVILGTLAYMVPEQADGLAADKRSDIWSYGVVLWEMLTGKRLFEAPSVSRLLADVMRKEIEFSQLPADTPAPLKTLLRRCLNRDVKNRLPDIGEARVAIDSVSRPMEPIVRPVNARPSLAWIAATVIFGLALAAVSVSHFREQPQARQRFKFEISIPEGRLVDLQLSPDGRFLAFSTREEAANQKLWVRSLDTLETRLLVSVRSVPSVDVFWSPDGEYLGYAASGKPVRRHRRLGSAIVRGVRNLRGMARGEQDARRGTVFDL